MPPGDGAFHERPLRASISEEVGRCERFIPRLVVHILAAGGQHQGGGAQRYFTEQLPPPLPDRVAPKTPAWSPDRIARPWLRCKERICPGRPSKIRRH